MIQHGQTMNFTTRPQLSSRTLETPLTTNAKKPCSVWWNLGYCL